MTTVALADDSHEKLEARSRPCLPRLLAAPPVTAMGRGQRNGPRADRGIRPVTYRHPGPAAATHPPSRSGRA